MGRRLLAVKKSITQKPLLDVGILSVTPTGPSCYAPRDVLRLKSNPSSPTVPQDLVMLIIIRPLEKTPSLLSILLLY